MTFSLNLNVNRICNVRENEVASEVGRINNNRKARLEDVDKANFSPERTAEIKAEINRRADNDIAIAKQALRTKLEDYKEFQKLRNSYLKRTLTVKVQCSS